MKDEGCWLGVGGGLQYGTFGLLGGFYSCCFFLRRTDNANVPIEVFCIASNPYACLLIIDRLQKWIEMGGDIDDF